MASELLYGSPLVVPIPDLERTDLLLIVGANPLVSHGSVLTAPRINDSMHQIVARGGRVVVLDPRRSETARSSTSRFDARRLAQDLAMGQRAAVYRRTGSGLGRHGTLESFLLDALNVVTGNLDREGGAIFGTGPIQIEDLLHRIGADSCGTFHSRIVGFPEVLGQLTASVMAKEITTPGEGQIRALFVSSGNPVLSVPNGDELERAAEHLELMVAIDLSVTETGRNADYVLPATTFGEREDFPSAFLTFSTKPFVRWTEAVLEPRGEARQEWEIIEEISRRIGTTPASARPLRALGRIGLRISPRRLIDLGLRLGPQGDLFGLRRGGLSAARLRRRPHGILLGDHHPVGVLSQKVFHTDKRVHLGAAPIVAEVATATGRAFAASAQQD